MVSAEAAAWALRLFAGREPRDRAEIEFHRNHPDLDSLRRAFAATVEFRDFLDRSVLQPPGYVIPPFLLRAPEHLGIPMLLEEPTLTRPVSQLCTASQFDEPAFPAWCGALGLTADHHRKTWEFCYILAVLWAAGVLEPGRRALGFGCGTEPIPALLARLGLDVLATDAPHDVIAGQGWDSTNQHTGGLQDLEKPGIVDRATFHARVAFRPVNMNAIPADLRGFDACWSSCAFEHLGSIAHGLTFFENSLATLRPGGVAVHTTEFNLQSNSDTYEDAALSLFRKRDIEALLGRLADAGHEVWPLNLHPGTTAVDEHIDLPPYALPHLKLRVANYVTTSIGLVVRKRPD